MTPQSNGISPRAAPSARTRVDTFVGRHFSVRGTLKLHRRALGWDLLRAPAIVALAPVCLLTRLAALLLAVLRIRRPARWLAERRILLPTSVAQAVGAAIREELLGDDLTQRQEKLIEDYTAVRNAISEICTTFVVLILGFAVFRIATPGVISLAPILSSHALRSRAVADFPLGQGLGSLWYGMFPVELPVWTVIAVGFALAMAASLVTSFAGIVADPVQARLGIHRRRLLKLMARIEAEGDASPGLAGEHILARAVDISDAVVSMVRFFRS